MLIADCRLLIVDCLKHRFQIFKKLGVKFNDLFLSTEQPQRYVNYFKENLPLEFSQIFKIVRITVFSSFSRIQENFRKKLKAVVISKPLDERSKNFQENHSL